MVNGSADRGLGIIFCTSLAEHGPATIIRDGCDRRSVCHVAVGIAMSNRVSGFMLESYDSTCLDSQIDTSISNRTCVPPLLEAWLVLSHLSPLPSTMAYPSHGDPDPSRWQRELEQLQYMNVQLRHELEETRAALLVSNKESAAARDEISDLKHKIEVFWGSIDEAREICEWPNRLAAQRLAHHLPSRPFVPQLCQHSQAQP